MQTIRLGPGLAVACACLVASLCEARSVIYVDDDAPSGGDGTSWSTAFRFLRDGLLAAAAGSYDTYIAQGTYYPDRSESAPLGTGDPAVYFPLIRSTSMQGGYAGIGAADPDERNPVAYRTILSGDIGQDDPPGSRFIVGVNSHRLLYSLGTDADTVLDGLTLTKASEDAITSFGPTIQSCDFIHNSAGAIINRPRFYGCRFIGNAPGGGVNVPQTPGQDPAADFVDCLLDDNATLGDSGLSFGGGGGAVLFNHHATFRHCVFRGNAALKASGGAVAGQDTALFVDCIFQDNQALRYGGAVITPLGGVTQFVNCQFLNNEAQRGGAVAVVGFGSQVLTNCLFDGNRATHGGAIQHSAAGSATLINCTLVGNLATQTGGGISTVDPGFPGGGPAAFYNSILWNNADASGQTFSAQITTTGSLVGLHCCIKNLAPTMPCLDCLTADPRFASPLGTDGLPGTSDDDLRLTPASPCIETGITAAVGADTFDIDDDGDVLEPIPWDAAGSRRVVDGDADTVATIDMGAFEFHRVGDLDGDGYVNGLDLATLLGQWGACQPPLLPTCSGDLNGDGFVNGLDLAAARGVDGVRKGCAAVNYATQPANRRGRGH